MLDKLRKRSRGLIIWFLFGIIILSFVVTFGPASMQLSCGKGTTAGKVAGKELSIQDVNFAFRLLSRDQGHPTDRFRLLDWLVRREILANEAKRLGLQASEDEVNAMIKRGRFLLMGQTQELFIHGGWPAIRDKTGELKPAPSFNYPKFKKWVKYRLQMKVKPDFINQQKKELLAQKAETLIKNGVLVSERELQLLFELESHLLKLEFARFKVDDFKDGQWVRRAEINTWLSQQANRNLVDARYEKVKAMSLTGLPAQRRVRHLLFKVKAGATEAEKAAVRGRLEILRAPLAAAPLTFVETALVKSEDDETKATGGDLGWKTKDELGQGKAFAEAIFKLKPLTVSAIIASDKGFHLAIVEGQRKGDATLAQARPWLAEAIILEQRAKNAAKKIATQALGMLIGGKAMDDVFPAPPDETSDATARKKHWHKHLPLSKEITVFRYDNQIGDFGQVEGLLNKVWKLSEKDPVLTEVIALPGSAVDLGSLVLIRLKGKSLPDPKDFADARADLMPKLTEQKQADAVIRWVYARCEALRAKGEIDIADRYKTVTSYEGGQASGKKKTHSYRACQELPRSVGDPRYLGFR